MNGQMRENLMFAHADHDQHKYLSSIKDGKFGLPLFFCRNEEIHKLILYAIELQKQKPAAYEMMTKSILLLMLAKLAQADGFIPLCPAKQEGTCKKILVYIEHHYMDKLTVSEISAAVGISPAYFSTFFSRHFRQRFADYLRNYRIEQACILLTNTTLSIAEIALSTGFGSSSHFIQRFGEIRGMTPLAYRRGDSHTLYI